MDKWTIQEKINNLINSPSLMSLTLHLHEEVVGKLKEISNDVEQLSTESVRWSVEDFCKQACEREEVEYSDDLSVLKDKLKIYDADKFRDALERMMDKHDATIGITWDTIDCYLDDYCKKP